MLGAVGAAIAGIVVGWGVASGLPLVAAVAAVGGVVVVFLDRARLADHRLAPSVTVTSQAGWEDFHRELARARRHERPVAIVRLPGATSIDAPDRAAAIAPFVRRIDRIWAEHGDVTIVLPESDRAAAERLVERIRARRPESIGTGPAIAVFPADGLTSGALLAALYGAPLPSVPVPVGVGRPVELPADVIELRPHLAPGAPLTDRRESSS